MLLVITLFSLPALAKLVDSGIGTGDANRVESAIVEKLAGELRDLYVMKCSKGGKDCAALLAKNVNRVEDVSEELKGVKADEVTIYCGVEDQAHVQQFRGFKSFVNEQNIEGSVWYCKIVLGGKIAAVHGRAGMFAEALEKGRINFMSATIPSKFPQVKDPDEVVSGVFKSLKGRLRPGFVNFVIFPEFFFNRIYRKRPYLKTAQVENILKLHRDCFGEEGNVIFALSFLHMFSPQKSPEWLPSWDRPGWLDEGELREYLVRCDTETVLTEHVDKKRHLANYQLFIWNQMKLGVYRKGCYRNELKLSRDIPQRKALSFVYEFGNWKTKRVSETGLAGEIASALFGDSQALIVPRICGDIRFTKGLGKQAEIPEKLRSDINSLIQKNGMLLVTSAGAPRLEKDLEGLLSKDKTLVSVDNDNNVHYVRKPKQWTERSQLSFTPLGSEQKYVTVHATCQPSQPTVSNAALVSQSNQIMHKDLTAALYHLTRFISRHLGRSCQQVSPLNQFIGDFSSPTKVHKRSRSKDLTAALYHLKRFIHRYHRPRAVKNGNSSMLVWSANEEDNGTLY